jgi:hypothetical protein
MIGVMVRVIRFQSGPALKGITGCSARSVAAGLALCIILQGCAPIPLSPPDDLLDDIFGAASGLQAVDARAEFRRIYCDIYEARIPATDDDRSCEASLRALSPENSIIDPVPASDEIGESFAILVAPGLGYDCFESLIGNDQELVRFAEARGHVVRVAGTDGLADTVQNAAVLRDAIIALDEASGSRRLLVLSYSKGTNDILEALVSYPGLADRVTAVVGVASAVGGSPLAPEAPLWTVNLLARIPGAECGNPPTGALPSLYPNVRQQWLAENTLPGSVRYFSIISLPKPEQLAPGLRISYRKLAKIDPHNDGQVIARDQVIPGSRVLAFVNADHWAIALPISRLNALLGSVFFAGEEFPRDVLLEAILRYVSTVVPMARGESASR